MQDAVHEQQRNAAEILLRSTGGSADGGVGGSAPGNTGQSRSAPAAKPSSLPTLERTSSSMDEGIAEASGKDVLPYACLCCMSQPFLIIIIIINEQFPDGIRSQLVTYRLTQLVPCKRIRCSSEPVICDVPSSQQNHSCQVNNALENQKECTTL